MNFKGDDMSMMCSQLVSTAPKKTNLILCCHFFLHGKCLYIKHHFFLPPSSSSFLWAFEDKQRGNGWGDRGGEAGEQLDVGQKLSDRSWAVKWYKSRCEQQIGSGHFVWMPHSGSDKMAGSEKVYFQNQNFLSNSLFGLSGVFVTF